MEREENTKDKIAQFFTHIILFKLQSNRNSIDFSL
jgi:hypothetical protein